MVLHLWSWPSLHLFHPLGERCSVWQVACAVPVLTIFYVPDLAASARMGRSRLRLQHMLLVLFGP